jgi:cytochrome b6-f complex iron-sulfur subunit
MKRRRILNIILSGGLLGWLASVLYPVIAYLKPPKIAEANVSEVKAGDESQFSNNSGSIVKFGRKPVILVRTEAGDFRAFSAVCTHLDCIVQYRKDTKQIWCACHNGTYDLQGRNVSGPPPRPLEPYAVKVVKGEIYISQEKENA